MTGSVGTTAGAPDQVRPPVGRVVAAIIRAVASTAVLLAVYYGLPLERIPRWELIMILAIGILLLIGLVVVQTRLISSSPFPGVRAVEAVAVSVPLFLLLFAGCYVAMSTDSGGSFTEPMTHTNALYFSVTVFSTVGFGDISAKTEAARVLVTVQMVLNLIVLGVGARVIVGAVQRGRRAQPPEDRRIGT